MYFAENKENKAFEKNWHKNCSKLLGRFVNINVCVNRRAFNIQVAIKQTKGKEVRIKFRTGKVRK
ncbi:MAG: hypothetical protein ACUVWQ_10185 [Candidatus Aminicenantales bacterium]